MKPLGRVSPMIRPEWISNFVHLRIWTASWRNQVPRSVIDRSTDARMHSSEINNFTRSTYMFEASFLCDDLLKFDYSVLVNSALLRSKNENSTSRIFLWYSKFKKQITRQILGNHCKQEASVTLDSFMYYVSFGFQIPWRFVAFSRRRVPSLSHLSRDVTYFRIKWMVYFEYIYVLTI